MTRGCPYSLSGVIRAPVVSGNGSPVSRSIRFGLTAAVALLAPVVLAGCAADYSPNTYNATAVQQANKAEPGVIIGFRQVSISASGAVGAVAGGAAGGILGSQIGPNGALGAVGGTVVGTIVGTSAEHMTGDTTGWEYIVRKPNGDLLSVTQREPTPIPLGQKVLVITGNQARIVPDYTVNIDPEPKPEPKAEAKPEKPAKHAAPAPVAPAPVTPAPETPTPGAAPASPPPVVPAEPTPAAKAPQPEPTPPAAQTQPQSQPNAAPAAAPQDTAPAQSPVTQPPVTQPPVTQPRADTPAETPKADTVPAPAPQATPPDTAPQTGPQAGPKTGWIPAEAESTPAATATDGDAPK
ncbi:outer membrane lipoprotein SlyB [Nitrospirillum bahiense]|uniref:Outer membrane lipoprotein SlyB n=1 Tax=Nitrospirillum amazonense TaxID=28077 RepID=A0A560F609_9PROT|nr:outer membrane lipoprotein SlyB [Nitrospirillum amazonense]